MLENDHFLCPCQLILFILKNISDVHIPASATVVTYFDSVCGKTHAHHNKAAMALLFDAQQLAKAEQKHGSQKKTLIVAQDKPCHKGEARKNNGQIP